MKALCVCGSANVRSVTLARLLKKRGYAIFCAGTDEEYGKEGLSMVVALAEWADVIYSQADAADKLRAMLPESLHEKIDLRYDVGPDDWKVPDHPDLLRRLRDLVQAGVTP